MKQRMKKLSKYSYLYKQQLFDQIIPFWEKYSIDKQYGGFFTCIDQQGNVYDTDKFMELQGMQVWFFSLIYNSVAKKQQWLQVAKHGADFMMKYGKDTNNNWYFAVTQKGQPLTQPYDIFSDCYAAIAFCQLYKATNDPTHKKIALTTYNNILQRSKTAQEVWKTNPSPRKLKNFALPMMLCNLSSIFSNLTGKIVHEQQYHLFIQDILNNYIDKEKGILLENVGQNGNFIDCFEGRVVNPGHGNQCLWFLLDLGNRYNNQELLNKCVDILLKMIQLGWDTKHEGLFSFIDIKDHPVQQLEWDQKLWWTHIQTMLAFLKAYKYTGNKDCKHWFKKVHEYTWQKFRDDKNNGEWYGYLNRKGKVLLKLKGGKWKGCYHVPWGLYEMWKIIDQSF